MNLKRLWDTENKKIVWAIPTWDPHKKLQVWTNDDGSKLYVYTWSAFRELSLASATVSEYGPVWKALDDETVGYYLTNVPTDLYNWDEGDEVAYRFMNWTTVLQSWKVDEWETPEYTGDTPTKSATAQYTYTFSWWKPTLWPISKKTDFKAQFTSTVNEYDVTIESNNTDYWTVDVAFVEWQPYGTAISAEGNVLTIWEGTSAVEVTATAEDGYVFSSWGEVPATVTGNTSITATFWFWPLENLKLVTGEWEAILFSGDDTASNYIDIIASYDSEADDWTVNVSAIGLFDDDFFVVDGDNVWVTALESLDGEIASDFIGEYVEWGEAVAMPTEIFTAAQTLYATPSTANASALTQAITDYYTPEEPVE